VRASGSFGKDAFHDTDKGSTTCLKAAFKFTYSSYLPARVQHICQQTLFGKPMEGLGRTAFDRDSWL
jgi:hypothetical protein